MTRSQHAVIYFHNEFLSDLMLIFRECLAQTARTGFVHPPPASLIRWRAVLAAMTPPSVLARETDRGIDTRDDRVWVAGDGRFVSSLLCRVWHLLDVLRTLTLFSLLRSDFAYIRGCLDHRVCGYVSTVHNTSLTANARFRPPDLTNPNHPPIHRQHKTTNLHAIQPRALTGCKGDQKISRRFCHRRTLLIVGYTRWDSSGYLVFCSNDK
ncbi:hypothetical protein P168DRAFT_170365 [Aspergillus campestris IBT 28561]|uniref:Uncharacterized protein n=1 Tax=Aspergillus campestris (strain IBT 28561) TaxID=1392248 RepID=A0A2I1D1S9_ASPC2|nr:uncharacterized protein P168DRAFT_170365 [Aspergillus campestris IBT 28561]PKY03835.1 hypothetical protein P168DRAFT_170365 [Aspergillus campestris IBT 28561]